MCVRISGAAGGFALAPSVVPKNVFLKYFMYGKREERTMEQDMLWTNLSKVNFYIHDCTLFCFFKKSTICFSAIFKINMILPQILNHSVPFLEEK